MVVFTLASPAQTRRLARALAARINPPLLVTVEGDLGSGKTTFVRAVLRARGVRGAVTSPSFTLAQSYRGLDGERLHHLDLYRLSRRVDASLFAWDDYLGNDAITFVEWPAAGVGALPPADLRLELEHRTRTTRTARLNGLADLEREMAAAARGDGIAVDIRPSEATDGDVAVGRGAEHAAGDGTAGGIQSNDVADSAAETSVWAPARPPR